MDSFYIHETIQNFVELLIDLAEVYIIPLTI